MFGWSSGGGTLQRLARAYFCSFCFVIWRLSSFLALVARVCYSLFFVFCLEFQIIRFVISTFTAILFFIEISFVFLPPPPSLMALECLIWNFQLLLEAHHLPLPPKVGVAFGLFLIDSNLWPFSVSLQSKHSSPLSLPRIPSTFCLSTK